MAAIGYATAENVLSQNADSVQRVTLLLFGDVNLGRNLGQELLKGNIDYPFARMKDILGRDDVVFVNLESPLSDQNGETESAKSNYIFCGPPQGATALKVGGVSVVSTANNHAFDYSLTGLRETIEYLDREHIQWTGTSKDSVGMFPPAIVKRNGIAIGFLAYTQSVNGPELWRGMISLIDSNRARREIQALRPKVDFVIASFHGGEEYAERPNARTLRQMRSLINAGADLVVGHHPHVAQGIEEYRGKLIFYSLGNFVFNQAFEWAKRAIGTELVITKNRGRTMVESVRLIPIHAFKQPSMDLTELQVQQLVYRLRELSTVDVVTRRDSILVSLPLSGTYR